MKTILNEFAILTKIRNPEDLVENLMYKEPAAKSHSQKFPLNLNKTLSYHFLECESKFYK